MNDADEFGDLEEDDILDDLPDLTPKEWSEVAALDVEMKAIGRIKDPVERRLQSKLLVQRMNEAQEAKENNGG